MDIIYLILIATLPVVFFAFIFYKMDKEKESIGFLFSLILKGVFSILLTLVISYVGLFFLGFCVGFIKGITGIDFYYELTGSFIETFIWVFFGIGIVEEYSKYFVMKKSVYKNPEFNEKYDAILYGAYSALGFALFENIMYSLQEGYRTAIVRAFTAVPFHTVCGVLMGMYIAKAKVYDVNRDINKKKQSLRKAVLYPALLHAFYDTFCFIPENETSLWPVIACMVLTWTVFIVLIIKTGEISKNNEKIYTKRYCKNCGTLIHGNFCGNCGQRQF